MSSEPETLFRKDWTFQIAADPAPALLRYLNVKNQDYTFAAEISVERVIVEVEDVAEPVVLTNADFLNSTPAEGGARLARYEPQSKRWVIDLQNFAVYKEEGIPVLLRSRPGTLPIDDAGVEEPLYLMIVFLVGDYGCDPPHEFTGVVSAARFTPAVRFDTRNKRVKSLRVDYRFHFDVGSFLKQDAAWVAARETLEDAWRKENYAALIRDADHFPAWVLATYELFRTLAEFKDGLESLSSDLAACNYTGGCAFDTKSLNLAIRRDGTELQVSYVDPRTRKTTGRQVSDARVAQLDIAAYDAALSGVVDELVPRVRALMNLPASSGVGLTGPLVFATPQAGPGPSYNTADACITNNVRYRLLQCAVASYGKNKLAEIATLIATVTRSGSQDYAAFLNTLASGSLPDQIKGLAKMLPLLGKVISTIAFEAVEKPVLYEVVGHFVRAGSVAGTWDNLHWWGTDAIPSAPGAYFAIHSHYRWTQLTTYPSEPEAALQQDLVGRLAGVDGLALGASQFRSLVKRFTDNRLSGPLIDPGIPNQTISFVIARCDGSLDKGLRTSALPFDKLANAPFAAKPIASVSALENRGHDLVYWLSCEAVRDSVGGLDGGFKGTLLINGFYFAHDPERPLSLPTRGVALQKPERKPRPPLFRNPQ